MVCKRRVSNMPHDLKKGEETKPQRSENQHELSYIMIEMSEGKRKNRRIVTNMSLGFRLGGILFTGLLLGACQEDHIAPRAEMLATSDDAPPEVVTFPANVVEGDEGVTELVFSIELNSTSHTTTRLDYSTGDGTATAGSDYHPVQGTVTIPPGKRTASIRVPVLGDEEDENDESLVLRLSNPVNAKLNTKEVVGTIVDDDEADSGSDTELPAPPAPPSPSLPRISIGDASINEGDEGIRHLRFDVSLDRAPDRMVTVDYTTMDGTAKAGSDYRRRNGRITFPVGESIAMLEIPILGDDLPEPDEKFSIVLRDPVNAELGAARATGTIRNDDKESKDSPLPPAIRIEPASTREGDEGSRPLSLAVTLDKASDKRITVRYKTVDGTAKAGTDYRAANGRITFSEGETRKTIDVSILGDPQPEEDERFKIVLSDPVNARLETSEAFVTIRNDDVPPLPRISLSSASVLEGNEGERAIVFTASLDKTSEREISVAYRTRDDDAVAGSDYRGTSGTLVIPPDTSSATISVTVFGDTEVEEDETFTLQLFDPVNATLETPRATGTIRNDDTPPLPRASVSDVSLGEGDEGNRIARFRIDLDKPSESEIRIDYSTAGGSATPGNDYEASSGTLTLPPGSTSGSIHVVILGDTQPEGDEIFRLKLTNPINVLLESDEAVGTILDDDTKTAAGDCLPSGYGNDYPVGPGQPYTNLADIPWGSLGPGDTVRIHYRRQPYREKIILRTSGTKDHPIRLCGVPGPNGERPVLDGDGASNDPDDRDAYGSYTPMEGLALVMLWHRDYETKVHDIVIEGLHIRNARNEFRYTRTNGRSAHYENGAACIRIQAGDNVVIRNNELENCGNGIFTMSQGYNEASLTRNLLIEGNHIHSNGQPGSYLEHGVYIQAINVVYQFNHFGPNAKGSDGVSLKERVAGSVIRYNWFDSGNARMLDLVEVEDAAGWYILDEYLRELGCTLVEGCSGIDPQRLAKVKEADRLYRSTYVYGNFFKHRGSETQAANIVHYGSDNDPALSRAGTLYFYNNTLSIQQDRSDAWRFRLFYLGNRNASAPARERVELVNNIIHFTGETGEPAYFCLNETNGGTIRFGRNWMTLTWQNPEAVSECYQGGPGAGPKLEGTENLLDTQGAPQPIDPETLAPADTPLVRNSAVPFATPYPVTRQYRPHLGSTKRTEVTTLGAKELSD